MADKWSLPPVRLLEFVAPRILGHVDQPDERWYWGGKLYPERKYPFLYSIYPGLLVALLSGAAVTRGPPRRWVWVGTAVLGALLAVGTHLPFWHLARSVVPGLKGLRYPEKFILLTVFATVVLSSFAFEELQRDRTDLRRRLVRGFGVVGFLATLAGLILLGLDVLRGNRYWVSWGISPAIADSWASVAAGDAIRIGATAAVGSCRLVFFRRAIWLLIAGRGSRSRPGRAAARSNEAVGRALRRPAVPFPARRCEDLRGRSSISRRGTGRLGTTTGI